MLNMVMTNLTYGFNADGATEYVNVNFNGKDEQNENYASFTIKLKNEDLQEGTTLDDLTRKKIDEYGRQKMLKLISNSKQ